MALSLKMDEETLKLREHTLAILLSKYGNKYTNKAIYECADEWVGKGHKISAGVVDYFRAYYSGRTSNQLS
jgi:hypothetical protein